MSARTVVLVEGESDRVALRAAAELLDHDLEAAGAQIVAMGGITNTRTFARRSAPPDRASERGPRLCGLYDAPEEARLRIGLLQAGAIDAVDAELEALGFFCCDRDLEEELIRALGADAVEAVIAAAGESRSLALLTQMPAQRGWTREAVLRRFIGARAGRKTAYARRMVEALEPAAVPRPLVALLAHVAPVA